ncbi:MAG: hypothetical protein OEV91_04520 [Desulfobulbaceae bacterium]|nr:hypothetical protein [Desulfobulbaceae bacterium]
MRGFDLTGVLQAVCGPQIDPGGVPDRGEDEVIVEVVGIGKRADFEVYAEVARRFLGKE